MQKPRPTIHLIAGPNGAGKTTFAKEFLPAADVVEFLNADLLAAGLSPLAPDRMALRSGRLLLERWKELVDTRRDFAFESTLSGRTYLQMLKVAKQQGYRIHLCYLWLPKVSLCLSRIKQRVRKGGHNVPPPDVRRRFGSSLRNFFDAYLPLWLTRPCSSMLPLTHLELLRAGLNVASSVSCITFMKRPASKPKTPKGKTDRGTDFFRKASAAMRRAQKAAERENARYGMKLVLADS